jgi:hypothetical protein
MLPFATNKDSNDAAKIADVSHETRNCSLQKLLREHSIIGARPQLKKLWAKSWWVETNYGAAGPESTGRGYGAEAETPEDSDDDDAREPGAGVDGSQSPVMTHYIIFLTLVIGCNENTLCSNERKDMEVMGSKGSNVWLRVVMK